MSTPWTLRPARPEDTSALHRLAALDSQQPLTGEIVIAEVGDEVWAAAGAGRAIADPFRPSRQIAQAALLAAA